MKNYFNEISISTREEKIEFYSNFEVINKNFDDISFELIKKMIKKYKKNKK